MRSNNYPQRNPGSTRRGDFARGQREGSEELRYDPDFARGQREEGDRYLEREPDYAEGMRENRWDDERRARPDYSRGQRSHEERGMSVNEPWTLQGEHSGRGPKGYQRSNDRIREDVCDRLTQHGQVDASDIDVQVQEGEVTLNGTVDTRQAKRLAEDTAFSVSGVRDVHNQLRVSNGHSAFRDDRIDR